MLSRKIFSRSGHSFLAPAIRHRSTHMAATIITPTADRRPCNSDYPRLFPNCSLISSLRATYNQDSVMLAAPPLAIIRPSPTRATPRCVNISPIITPLRHPIARSSHHCLNKASRRHSRPSRSPSFLFLSLFLFLLHMNNHAFAISYANERAYKYLARSLTNKRHLFCPKPLATDSA